MTIGVDDYGSRRHVRTIVLAGGILLIIWVFCTSRLFSSGGNSQYQSSFRLISVGQDAYDPYVVGALAELAAPPTPPPPGPPIVGHGDDFFAVDALDHMMNPPPPPPPPPVPFPDNVAVIMETDPGRVPNLVPVMLHFANVLGPRWPVVLLTVRRTWVEPASPAFRRLMAQGRIHIHFLPAGNGDGDGDAVDGFPDHRSVSLFLTRPWFWEHFSSAGRVLMFQADSVLCGRSGRVVDDFMEWDMIGAPIAAAYGVGYNGGLSLRNPRLMLEVVRDPANDFARDSAKPEVVVVPEKEQPPAGVEHKDAGLQPEDPTRERLEMEETRPEEPKKEGAGGPGPGPGPEPPRGEVETRGEGEGEASRDSNTPPPKPSWMEFEDQWFYMKLKERGANLPDQEVAKTFSVETIYYETPLGYHQPFRWLNQMQKKQAMEWCPEIGMLQDGSHFFS